MNDPTKAVFLSYARDDAAAARRIAEALRASGLEVWFDENELRGGDSWDAKIRKQINDCTLFLPIISAHTQERNKGYFRLEWKLAVEQTHLMAEGVPFIAPVVVDDTKEAAAVVPPEFMKVQWTRLPGALPTPQFVEQIKRLLGGNPVAGVADPGRRAAEPGSTPSTNSGQATPATKKSIPGWTWGAVTAVVIGIGVALYVSRQPAPTPPVAASASEPKPASPAPVAKPPLDFANAKSIAVLPFANMSSEKENEFFADGVHDDLITALAKVRDLKVISRTSVLAYRDTGSRNLKKIAADLGVAAVLEGSVQRAGNRVRINLQLIDARTDAHLWAETYNRELTDIFAIQAELVQQVTGALKATLTAGEQDLLARRPTESQVAYDLYLRARLQGQAIGLNIIKDEYEAVIALYDQAAAADPKFALPHVQLSILHGTMFWFGALDPTPARRARVESSLAAAVRLAPDAPETHLARGSYEYTCRNDWAQALVEYRKAEAALPNDAQLIYRMGAAHRRLGQYAEAQQRFERAIGLNPSDLNAVITYFESLLDLRRYRQVGAEIDRFVALFPKDRRLQLTRVRARFGLDGDRAAYLRDMAALPRNAGDPHGLSAAYEVAMRGGDLAAAERLLEDPKMPPPGESIGAISYPRSLARARLAWLQGRSEDARRLADEAIAYFQSQELMPRQAPIARMGGAIAHAFAGRHPEALREARAACDDLSKRDVYAATAMRIDYGQILVICGRRDEAIELLPALVSDFAAARMLLELHFDPIWSRLKDDPRFEEILRSAKPL